MYALGLKDAATLISDHHNKSLPVHGAQTDVGNREVYHDNKAVYMWENGRK